VRGFEPRRSSSDEERADRRPVGALGRLTEEMGPRRWGKGRAGSKNLFYPCTDQRSGRGQLTQAMPQAADWIVTSVCIFDGDPWWWPLCL